MELNVNDPNFVRKAARLKVSEMQTVIGQLRELAGQVRTEEESRMFTSKIAQLIRMYRINTGTGIAESPLEQAKELDPSYKARPHLAYLSARIVNAVRDVENGHNRKMLVSMPPRAGKSTMTSKFAPLWMLRRHPEWKFMMTSHDGRLTAEWASEIRRYIEEVPELGVALRPDAGARGRWNTVEGGGMYTTSVGGKIIGRGARVFIIDDPVSDFASAHSLRQRDSQWNWWLSDVQSRLEPPSLVFVTMTRWHEDDFAGRLLSPEHEGDPKEWENIRLPALAEDGDVLRRPEGAPLISPLLDESPEQAVLRWEETRRSMGSYVFASAYQQRPAPQKGAIFDVSWWRYWTRDPGKATDDGRVVYLEPEKLAGSRWVDSWDCTFKGNVGSSSYVVGQRWVKEGGNRYLISQQRGRWTFTETIRKMEQWALTDDEHLSPHGSYVHERLIEDKANGPAIIDVLRDKIAGIKPINPKASKEARARSVSPEIESGNVYLPHPTDSGNGWVNDLLSELRNFPFDTSDDQVDALTQALSNLREVGKGRISSPARIGRPAQGYRRGSITEAAKTSWGFHR